MDPRAIIVCADHEQAASGPMAAPAELRAHAVTGLARTAPSKGRARGCPRRISAILAPGHALRAQLDTLETLVIAWPESFSGELDTLLREAPEARR